MAPQPNPDVAGWRKLDEQKGSTLAETQRGEQGGGSLAWIGIHWQELVQQYPNRWILIADRKMAADAATPSKLAKEARRLGIKRPFITKIGQGPIVWIWRKPMYVKSLEHGRGTAMRVTKTAVAPS